MALERPKLTCSPRFGRDSAVLVSPVKMVTAGATNVFVYIYIHIYQKMYTIICIYIYMDIYIVYYVQILMYQKLNSF